MFRKNVLVLRNEHMTLTLAGQQKKGRMGESFPSPPPAVGTVLNRGGLLTAGVGGRSRVRAGLVDRAGVDRQA